LKVVEEKHKGICCSSCSQNPIQGDRIFCITCEANFCQDCLDDDKIVYDDRHTTDHHMLRVDDSRRLTPEKIIEWRNTPKRKAEHDAFAFQTYKRYKFKDDPRALNLIKKMLRRENEYRLGQYFLNEYKQDQSPHWKAKVTVKLQEKVVKDFMNEASGFYENIDQGIKFLRAASGNFSEKIEELKECANYIKFTHFCVRGELRPEMKIDLSKFPLIDPMTGKNEFLSDWLVPDRPLVIIASSYT